MCVPLCEPGFADIKHPAPPAPDDGCESAAPPPPKMVFISKAVVTVSALAAMGGIAGADALCDQYAHAIGAPPMVSFKAWISDTTHSAASRLTHSPGEYRRPDGALVAANWSALVSGTLANPISVNEDGLELAFGEAWTGTDEFGNSAALNCGNWVSLTTRLGIVGDGTLKGPDWTLVPGGTSCLRDDVHLYCIEQ